MKFAAKMVAVISLLLAISLAIGGYTVIGISFNSRLTSEISDAQEDMKLFCITVQALYLSETKRNEDADILQSLRSTLQSETALQSYEFRVTNGQQQTITSTDHFISTLQRPSEQGMIETRLVQEEGRYYALTTQWLEFGEEPISFERSREITGVFTQAQENLQKYQIIMLIILLCGVVLTSVLTLYLTRPIRRISRAAKQFSNGQYEKRAKVQSKDELGVLAQDFNSMADSLEAKIFELADAAQRQKDFTASFAHELKTPLTSVIGYADTLRSRKLPAQKQFEAANYIFNEGKRLESMSFALLDLFSLERNEPQMQLVFAKKFLHETAEGCSYMLLEDGIALVCEAEEAELNIAPELIKTLIYNLIDNARKASAANSVIRLQGTRGPVGYCISVTDSGKGISKEALQHITEPFYMADKSRARAQGGAGLGLALCSRIAHAHETTLQFHSIPGEGTRVELFLGGHAG